ncbi:MAG: hypothetical protein D6765_09990 [Bacteroidetes bacterium]|nr:MAG: hypothetical protein D6765_09990 [Bacteroidota bacterium]
MPGGTRETDGDIEIWWRAPRPAPHGYLLERSAADGSNRVIVAQLKGDALRYVDALASPRKSWTYYLTAFDGRYRLSRPLVLRYAPRED